MRRILLAGLLSLTFFAACGRDELSRSCALDAECRDGEACVSGVCVELPACSTDSDCSQGQTCINGVCNDASQDCTDNADCSEGQTCNLASGMCVSNACVAKGDLCVQEICDADGCTDLPCDLGCEPGTAQSGCECVDVSCSTSDDCGGVSCVDGVCTPCVGDASCGDGEICLETGICDDATRCTDDLNCGSDEECNADGLCRPRPPCTLDQDCDESELCVGGQCVLAPECTMTPDCPDGFECVGGNCFEALCRGAEDCERGQVCDAGVCVVPPAALSCFIATPSGTIVDGQTVALEAFAFDAAGDGVAAIFRWTSDNAAVADVDATGRNALGHAAAGTATFTATLATGDPVACDGEVVLVNAGPVAQGTLRISVINGETGAPVDGAVVYQGSAQGTTANGGIVMLMRPAGSFDVTVTHPNYNAITVQGMQTGDIKLPLYPRRGSGSIGGFTGSFDLSQIGSTGDINLGLAGSSLAGGLLELDLTALLGEPFVTPVNIPGVANTDFPFPGGLTIDGNALGFSLNFKQTYYSQSAAGARLAWGLAGKVPLRDIIQLGMGGGAQGNVLATLLPLFNRFDHTAQPMQVTAIPRVADTNDIDGDGLTMEMVPDYAQFPVKTLKPSVRQTLTTDVAISNFPNLPDGQAQYAVLLGSSVLDAPGLVPLGISATTDEDGDGRPDTRRLSVAPPSGSLANGRYAVVALAFGNGGGFQNGFTLPSDFSASLWNGQSFPTALSLGTFPDASTVQINNGARTITIQSSAGPLYRVRFTLADQSWDVWSYGVSNGMGSYSHTVTIPAFPTPNVDPFQNAGITVDAIQTNSTINDLVKTTGVGLRRAGLVSSAFNRTTAR